MKVPRVTIFHLMALVLLAALDFGICRSLMNRPLGMPDLSDLIVFGALPMANVLAVAAVVLARSPRVQGERSPAPVGFVSGGLAALMLFLACSLVMTRPLHEGVGHVLRRVGFVPGPVFLAGAVSLLLLPQLALALLGRWVWLRYQIRIRVKISVERRPTPGPDRLVAEGVCAPSAG